MSLIEETLEEVLDKIIEDLSEGDINYIKSTRTEDDLVKFHHTFGRIIRNNFGLWGNRNAKLLDDMGIPYKTHPDEVSQKIIVELWKKLNKTVLVKVRFVDICHPTCKHLHPTEEEQTKNKDKFSWHHHCKKYDKRLSHHGFHPLIVAIDGCKHSFLYKKETYS